MVTDPHYLWLMLTVTQRNLQSFSAFENFSEVPLLWGILEPCPAGDPKLGKALCWGFTRTSLTWKDSWYSVGLWDVTDQPRLWICHLLAMAWWVGLFCCDSVSLSGLPACCRGLTWTDVLWAREALRMRGPYLAPCNSLPPWMLLIEGCPWLHPVIREQKHRSCTPCTWSRDLLGSL